MVSPLGKKLDGNDTRMLLGVFNKSWKQQHTKHQLYDHLPLISITIQERRTRLAKHWWRSRDALICGVLLWTSTHGHTSIGRPSKTYIHHICADIGYSLEDLTRLMTKLMIYIMKIIMLKWKLCNPFIKTVRALKEELLLRKLSFIKL